MSQAAVCHNAELGRAIVAGQSRQTINGGPKIGRGSLRQNTLTYSAENFAGSSLRPVSETSIRILE